MPEPRNRVRYCPVLQRSFTHVESVQPELLANNTFDSSSRTLDVLLKHRPKPTTPPHWTTEDNDPISPIIEPSLETVEALMFSKDMYTAAPLGAAVIRCSICVKGDDERVK